MLSEEFEGFALKPYQSRNGIRRGRHGHRHGPMTTRIRTPAIDRSTVLAGSVSIRVDSFFRNQEPSDRSLDVSFDGGTGDSNLVCYESDTIADGAVLDEQLQFGVSDRTLNEFESGITGGRG